MSNDKIKPCRCGGEAERMTQVWAPFEPRRIECNKCGVSTKRYTGTDEKEITAWNKLQGYEENQS